jgi:1,4-dihydroxy-2-naphthoyl-CoA synthase
MRRSELTTVLFTTEDRVEGMTAFLEKRKAEFKGR